MQTTQLIKASAEVVTIASFAVGDVYKRVDTGAYSAEPVLRYGIVEDVQHNGEDAFISVVEYKLPEFGGTVDVADKVFDGSKSAALYPAQPEELRVHLIKLQEASDKAVEAAEKALAQAREKALSVAWLTARIEEGVQAPKVLRGAEALSLLAANAETE